MSACESSRVRDELYDHLMCLYERNVSVGMSPDAAGAEAISSLGDKQLLRHQLAQVHPYFPRLTIKKALTMLLVGFIFSSVHINLFDGMQQITQFIGNSLMLTAAFCMSSAGKKPRTAFAVRAVSFICLVLIYLLSPFLDRYASANIVLFGIQFILGFATWFCMLDGLRSMTDEHICDDCKPLRFGLNKLLYTVTTVPSFLVLISSGANEYSSSIPLNEGIGFILIIPFIAFLIASVQLLLRVNTALYKSEHEYKAEDRGGVKLAFFSSAVCLGIVLSMLLGCCYIRQPAETQPYNRNDIEMSEAEYAGIRAALLSYGMSDELVATLPKSEILQYRTLKVYKNSALSADLSQACFSNNYSEGYILNEYLLPIEDEAGHACIRVLRQIRCENYKQAQSGPGTRAACFPDCGKYNYLPAQGSDFILILKESDGIIYSCKPLKTYKNTHLNVTDGVEFSMDSSTDFYYAVTLALEGYSDEVLYHFSHKLVVFKQPLMGTKRSLKEIANSQTIMTVENPLYLYINFYTTETYFPDSED